jgi:biopolymer transport protein exbD/tolR
MARKSQPDILQSEDSFDLTSMIDVVFLLLIYFMYLPIQQEADLMFTLPAESAPQENVAMPSEQVVDIAPDGSIFLNGSPIDQAGALEFKELASTLRRLRISSERGGTSTIVTIYPDADSPHQAAISVLNACAESGVKQVSFAEAD